MLRYALSRLGLAVPVVLAIVVINFLIIAWVLFLVVRALNRLMAKEAEKPAKPAEAPRSEVLLQEIRDILASKPAKPA